MYLFIERELREKKYLAIMVYSIPNIYSVTHRNNSVYAYKFALYIQTHTHTTDGSNKYKKENKSIL